MPMNNPASKFLVYRDYLLDLLIHYRIITDQSIGLTIFLGQI